MFLKPVLSFDIIQRWELWVVADPWYWHPHINQRFCDMIWSVMLCIKIKDVLGSARVVSVYHTSADWIGSEHVSNSLRSQFSLNTNTILCIWLVSTTVSRPFERQWLTLNGLSWMFSTVVWLFNQVRTQRSHSDKTKAIWERLSEVVLVRFQINSGTIQLRWANNSASPKLNDRKLIQTCSVF